MPRLVVYSDYVCPFSYLARPVLARLQERDGVECEVRPFELYPAPGPLPEAPGPPPAEAWQATLLPLARELGVDLRPPALLPRTRKAHEAAAFARAQGRFPALHEAIFRAHFVEGRDIGRIDVLRALAAEQGLDPQDLGFALGCDRYAGEVAAHEAAAFQAGIEALPAFVARDETRLGLFSYEALRAWVRGSAQI